MICQMKLILSNFKNYKLQKCGLVKSPLVDTFILITRFWISQKNLIY